MTALLNRGQLAAVDAQQQAARTPATFCGILAARYPDLELVQPALDAIRDALSGRQRLSDSGADLDGAHAAVLALASVASGGDTISRAALERTAQASIARLLHEVPSIERLLREVIAQRAALQNCEMVLVDPEGADAPEVSP